MRQKGRTHETDRASNWQVFRLELSHPHLRADEVTGNESGDSSEGVGQLLEPQADLDFGQQRRAIEVRRSSRDTNTLPATM